ncbi:MULTISPECIES: formaldehyde-activating enzyme [Amycolatopsis]|uniref:Formaldehyde-activating enzyme n=1 Tax=Amycolatopsis tucumanensis TaxID=401106 RepID=A0ABP7J9W9_9PSEU|nr:MULTISPECIES: formaldehyde-activating enzyme [Amycolatopsis]MCF6421841.1 formaldehyde-activating enzyme [Amycolatopsis tucumanensis]
MTFAPAALVGESFVGTGVNAAHTNIVVGRKGGPVETAWATALATPSAGHVPFVTVVRPGVPVKPLTLFVTKAAASGDLHERATWGSAQAGLAQGVADAVEHGLIPAAEADDLLIIAAIWVNPGVADLDESFRNQRAAAFGAIRAAVAGTPTVDEVRAAARAGAANPFYEPGATVLAESAPAPEAAR